MRVSTFFLLMFLSFVMFNNFSFGAYSNWYNYPSNNYYPYSYYYYYRPTGTQQTSSDSTGTSYYQYDPSSGSYKLQSSNSGYYYLPGYGYVSNDNNQSSQDYSSLTWPYYNYKSYWPNYYYPTNYGKK
ncbi:hypothetical protein Mgra_00009088 [Meloidogyne graminicola]|uniref:Uncharacterized protein n=1 Tax=Meloidogyne graminicola TaxID=189291 RepID=A0A8S9ZDV9_9BILA|nr:hypothetical protein Mgra_00009088 [Meloidogyne graminicola]